MFLLRPCLADFVIYYIRVQPSNGEGSHPHPPVWCEAKQVHHLHHPLIKKQHVLYLCFRSTASWASFHCERKSILHTWKQLVMVLLELNLDQIIHGWVIQGKHYLCSTLPESPLLFIFIGMIYFNEDCRARLCICWTWEHFILGFFFLFDFFPPSLLVLCLLWWVLCCFFFFFV